MKASAREQRLQEVEAKAKGKAKRKREKQAEKNAPPTAVIPPSPQRVAKKVKGDDEKQDDKEVDDEKEHENTEGNQASGDKEKEPQKTTKTKRPDAGAIKGAWGDKEWYGLRFILPIGSMCGMVL